MSKWLPSYGHDNGANEWYLEGDLHVGFVHVGTGLTENITLRSTFRLLFFFDLFPLRCVKLRHPGSVDPLGWKVQRSRRHRWRVQNRSYNANWCCIAGMIDMLNWSKVRNLCATATCNSNKHIQMYLDQLTWINISRCIWTNLHGLISDISTSIWNHMMLEVKLFWSETKTFLRVFSL